MLPGFADGEFHAVVGHHLADIVMSVDQRGGFALAQNLRLLGELDGTVLNPAEIRPDARDAVSRIAAQIGLDEELGQEPRVFERNPARAK
jgi:hypothetical protein